MKMLYIFIVSIYVSGLVGIKTKESKYRENT